MGPKMWRGVFDKEGPAEKKAKYTSDEFKKKCDDLFKKADTKEPFGQLTRDEIKVVMGDFFGPEIWKIPDMTPEKFEELKKTLDKDSPFVNDMLTFMIKSFDDNKDEKINQEEFMELMKLLSWMTDSVKESDFATSYRQEVAKAEAAKNKA